MTPKDQFKQDLIEQILFEIYDAGVKHEECNITDHFKKLMQALNIQLNDITNRKERENE